MKTCLTCLLEKPLTDFYKHSRNKSGFLSYCKMCQNKNSIRRASESRKRVLEIMGGKCIKCGFDDWRALQVDHVNGGGSKELKENGQRSAYKKAASGDPNYQLLCANCNWIKRYENNETKSIVV